jgi:photosystem II stability/assembly factor-like uncharacterized protein
MSRPYSRVSVLTALAALACAGVLTLRLSANGVASQSGAATTIDPIVLGALKWRSVGPDPGTQVRSGDATRGRGGRSIAISGVRGRPNDGYFGAVGGGLWKTTDRGETWFPVTDGQIHSSSVGAVAVSETNPDLVYIGMGESCIRGNAMSGDGVYKSTDAGKTWTHVGFEDAPVISKIRIHPTNPDIVFVAAFGKLSAPSERRGVFKSTDGGRTWTRVLFRDAKTAAVDLSIDPRNPHVMFAALWEAFRLEYTMSSGGPGSGLFKSTDGGDTWTEITRYPGMPAGIVGRIGVAVSGADSSRVYAIIENQNGGLFRSDDGGATWALVNGGRNIRQRAFYYTHIAADPALRDVVYVLNVGLYKSADGGKTMESFAFGDSHDLWIDPDDTNHLLHAMDGGGAVTYSGGRSWSARDYPTAQYYHVVTTQHLPYHVCGAHQDGSSVCVSSAPAGPGSGRGGAGAAVAPYGVGGTESATIAADPTDLDVFFSGGNNGMFIQRLNRRTGESREVGPYPRVFSGEPSSALVERVQWTFPIIFSPVDPRVLYTATQHVWKTTNGGQDWQRISGDLTRHDPKTMGDSGGPITHDMNSPEVYATVFAIGPGKTDANVIWAGSDDGLIHVTRDGGRTWSNVTPAGMPDFGRVSVIDASSFEPGSAYAAVKRPLLDDVAPYIFRTHDFGGTWTKIVTGIAPTHYVHAVREDPGRRGLLYAGTQHGVAVSFDDGDHWQSLSLNLPDAQVSDLVVESNDLVIATHGRGFYVLDNLGPLRQIGAPGSLGDAYLFRPNDAIRSTGGAVVQYVLRKPAQALTIDIVDAQGAVIRSFAGGDVRGSAAGTSGTSAPAGRTAGGAGRAGGAAAALMSPGLNSVTWDLRYPGATSFPGMILWGGTVAGPTAPPGPYQVRMTVDGRVQAQPFTVRRHPLYSATDADLGEQFALAIRIRDKTSEANNTVIRIREIKAQTADRLSKSSDARLKAAGQTLTTKLTAVEEAIYQVRNQSGQDPLNFPIKINNRLASLLSVVNRGDGKPIGNTTPIFNDLVRELKEQTDRFATVLSKDLAALNVEIRRLGLDVVK